MPKRSEVYFHAGSLVTLGKGIEETDKKFYARDGLSYRKVYRIQGGSGKYVCLVCDLEDDTDPFPPIPQPSGTLGDRLLDAAVREMREAQDG